MTILLLVLAGAAILWSIVSYNLLVRDRNRVEQSWSDVGVHLARRLDLIAKLVEAVKLLAG